MERCGRESRATQPNRCGIYRYPKYIHFHFEHYARVGEKGEEARMAIEGERKVVGECWATGGGGRSEGKHQQHRQQPGYYQEPMI